MKQTLSPRAVRYFAVTFGAAWALQLVSCWAVYHGQAGLFTPLMAVSMFAPMLGAWAASGGLRTARSGIAWRPLFRGRAGWWLAALLGPAVLTVLCAAFYFILFPARFDAGAQSYLTAALGAEGAARAAGGLAPAAFMAVVLAQGAAGGVFNMLFAVGEEAGWRGWMYPRLKARFGARGGRALGGVIWGVWHWPVIALAGYEYNLSVFSAPLYLAAAGMLLFCVVCVALGALLDLLYEKTGCIWVPALAHGEFNAVASAALYVTVADYAGLQILGPLPIGLIAGVPLFAAGAAVLARSRAQKA